MHVASCAVGELSIRLPSMFGMLLAVGGLHGLGTRETAVAILDDYVLLNSD